MFSPLRADLAATEAKLQGALAALRSEASAVAAELAALEDAALSPLEKVKAAAAEAAAEVTRSLLPVRHEVSSLLPPSA